MADYIAVTRTNWFHVASPASAARLRNLLDEAETDSGDALALWHDPRGNAYAFGAFGAINGLFDEAADEYDIDAFYGGLTAIVADGDAVIVTTVGHEALRAIDAHVVVVAAGRVRTVDLTGPAIGCVRELLGDGGWTTRFDD